MEQTLVCEECSCLVLVHAAADGTLEALPCRHCEVDELEQRVARAELDLAVLEREVTAGITALYEAASEGCCEVCWEDGVRREADAFNGEGTLCADCEHAALLLAAEDLEER